MSDLVQRFDAIVRAGAARAAVVEGDRALSYSDLWRWSDRLAAALDHPGGEVAGHPVALVLPNSAGFVAAFLAAARAGAVVAPLSPGYRLQELTHYLRDMEPAAVLVDGETAPLVQTALGAGTSSPRVHLVTEAPPGDTLATGDDGARPRPATADGSLLLLYTSGSTGPAKRVIRSHRQLLAEIEALHALLAVTAADRFLGASPFSHVNGLVRSMLTAVLGGATLYPVRRFGRRAVLELIGRERLTFFGGVPPMFARLGQTPPGLAADLSTLRIVFSASAPLVPADARAFHRAHGVYVRQLYGSTETGTITYNDHPRIEERLESVGRPLPGVRIAVLGEDGRPVPPGVEGQIAVASPFAIGAYHGNPDATRASFRDGAYLTGDLGRLAADGFLTLTGRTSLLINRGGYKVNPVEVETAMRRHPKVADVAVVGVTGPGGDEVIRGVVVPRATCTPEEIIAHCREWIADYKIPSQIEFCAQLPRTPTGKVRRQWLRDGDPSGAIGSRPD
jgi:long-chain acyl-CoA synthetase